MSEQRLQEAIEAVREVHVDPASPGRVAERIEHAALMRRRPWKILSLAAALLLAFLLWPRPDAAEPSAAAPDEEEVEETPIETPAGEEEKAPDEEEPEVVEKTPIIETVERLRRKVEDLRRQGGLDVDEIKRHVDEMNVRMAELLRSLERSSPEAAAKKWGKKLAAPLAKLRKLPGGRIVVRMGEFDSVHDVLKHYRLPHTVTADLDAETLAKARVVFIPCSRHPSTDVDFGPLRKFVQNGGWLVVSDRGLRWLQRAAPGTIGSRKTEGAQPEAVIDVEAGATSPLLEGVIDGKTPWWIEESSQFARTFGDGARILVRSPAWKKRHGSDDLVAVCSFGDGLVVFTQAHFRQDAKGGSVASMHRFVLNILIERFLKK